MASSATKNAEMPAPAFQPKRLGRDEAGAAATAAAAAAAVGATATEETEEIIWPESETRLSCCKSERTAAAVGYRKFRSFSMHLLMISSSCGGIRGFTARTDAGARVRMASIIAPAVLPPNAWRPVAIS